VAAAAGGGAAGPLTLAVYGRKWLDERAALGLVSARDDRIRLGRHVLPKLGHMLLTAVRPRNIRDLMLELRRDGKLAPRTIHHVYHAIRAMFRDAVADELLDVSPCVLRKGVLPKKAGQGSRQAGDGRLEFGHADAQVAAAGQAAVSDGLLRAETMSAFTSFHSYLADGRLNLTTLVRPQPAPADPLRSSQVRGMTRVVPGRYRRRTGRARPSRRHRPSLHLPPPTPAQQRRVLTIWLRAAEPVRLWRPQHPGPW
jgi:hypothetical protein